MHCLPSRRSISSIWADWQRLCRRLNNNDYFERIFGRRDFRVWRFLVCVIKRGDPNRVRNFNLWNCRLQCLLGCRKATTTRSRPGPNREDHSNYLDPRLKSRRYFKQFYDTCIYCIFMFSPLYLYLFACFNKNKSKSQEIIFCWKNRHSGIAASKSFYFYNWLLICNTSFFNLIRQ
jgi:hypothetical protein